MDYRLIKNVINDNDFFKLRKSYDKHKKLPKLESIEPKNLILHKSYVKNINGLNNEITPINNSNISSFPNDIESENNIGRYKEKIFFHLNNAENNYKIFDHYKNKNLKRLNLANKFLEKNGKCSNGVFQNYTNLSNSIKINPYLSKSLSSRNILQNRYYLATPDKDYLNQPFFLFKSRYMGKKRTDITNDDLIFLSDMKNNGLIEYKKKNKEYLNDNQKMVEDKINKERVNHLYEVLREQRENIKKSHFYKNLYSKGLLNSNCCKVNYKKLLDEQVNSIVDDKLVNENLTYRDVIQNQIYLNNKNSLKDRKFLNANKFVDVNPYNQRDSYLGETSLKHNTILNPQVRYNINKYFFPQINE